MLQRCRFIGVPGAGKTTRAMEVIDKVRQRGYRLPQIGFVTFTRAARREASTRAADLFGAKVDELERSGWFRTIHSACIRCSGGLEKGQIVNNDTRWLREVMDDDTIGINEDEEDGEAWTQQFRGQSPVTLALTLWEIAKNRLISLQEVYEHALKLSGWLPGLKTYDDAEMFALRYEAAKAKEGKVDFSDILLRYAGRQMTPAGPVEVEPLGYVPDVPVWILDECLPGSSLVTLTTGEQVPIEKIVREKLQVEVLSLNLQTGLIEPKPVVGWIESPLRDRRIVRHGPLEATEDHPVLTQDGFRKAGLLLNAKILELDHEKLRSSRTTHGETAFHYCRFTSWRCFNQQECRTERECQNQVHSLRRPGVLSELEVPGTQAVGSYCAYRTYSHGVRQQCLSVLHHIPPSVHGDMGQDGRQKGRALDRMGSSSPGFTGPSRMVHGRRLLLAEQHVTSYLRLPQTVASSGRREVSGVRNQVTVAGGAATRFLDTLSSRWSGFPIEHHPKPYPSAIQLQAGKGYSSDTENEGWKKKEAKKASSNEGRTEVISENESAERVQNLQESIRSTEGNGHLQQGMPSHPDEQLAKTVYCLKVEGNNNFFANGILVHNCQDQSPLLDIAAQRLSSNAIWLYLLGDPEQGIYTFGGADSSCFMRWPVVHEEYLKKTWRCSKNIINLGLNLVRMNESIAPALRALQIEPKQDGGEIETDWEENLLHHISDPSLRTLVMARTNNQAFGLHKQLTEARIPWRSVKGSQRWPPLASLRTSTALQELASGGVLDGDSWRRVVKAVPASLLQRGTKSRFAPAASAEEADFVTLESMGQYGGTPALADYLREDRWVELVSAEEKEATEARRKWGELADHPAVCVSTIHGTKGLEADKVILSTGIPGAVAKHILSQEGREEERRVFYVGCTRAKDHLVLLRSRFRNFDDIYEAR